MTPDVNRAEQQPDYSRLLSLSVLSQWTLDRQQEHATDRAAYEAALASFQANLRSQHVEGDGRLSAPLRARKVEKHLKALVKASRRAEAATEALRTTYAGHVAHLAALPAQREAKALKKSQKSQGKQAVGELTAKSLHKTATALQPEADDSKAEPAPAEVRGVADLWKGAKSA